MHDLVRAYATELSDPAEREETVRRAVDHQLHSLFACSRTVFPHQNPVDPGTPRPGVTPWTPADRAQARAWFGEEYENMPAVLDAAESLGLDRILWLFGYCLQNFLGEQMGRWDEAVTIGHRALAAAERQAESWWRSYLHNNLAGCYAELADYEQAVRQVEMAVRASREIGDPVRTATGLVGMAALLVEYGPWPSGERIERAAALADEALAVGETFDPASAPDRREADEKRLRVLRAAAGEYTAYRTLHRTGDLAAAVAEMERAIEIGRAEGINRESLQLDTVARFQRHAGADAEAVLTYERAIALQPDDVWPTAQRTAAMAACQARLGDRKAVARLRDRVRLLLDGVHHPAAVRLRAELDELGVAG
jgi:tetratricopeptide (TPR) repeat protein